ncbi:MAG: FAD-dependent oxidoreductase [Clostridia bacterium]
MIHKQEITGFKTIFHEVDFCVVGGGLAGMTAAISAARHNAKVLIMQDRPMFGGNASSEIRMWVRGAHEENNRETGILAEIEQENIYRNSSMNYSVWDSVLYQKVMEEENITILLNCSCCDAQMNENRIISVKGWQTTTQIWHEVKATIFADCSGDSVLVPLTGAEYRMGRESCKEFDEDIAPKISDDCTMGMSCLFQARETNHAVEFVPPRWAPKYTREDFTNKIGFCDRDKEDKDIRSAWRRCNYWWMELGGVYNSIDDTEMLRDELLKVAYGTWDFFKNSGEMDADNWELDWVGILPGKRESRRYVGGYILTQNDVRAEGKFDDLVAYGGWSMDDHNPKGFASIENPTTFHPAPSPYGIPYRCLYSKNIENLVFAGRNISATHSALSSCRVMATCAIIGQAVGTAVAIALENKLLPCDLYPTKIEELKQMLMDDDCYLPFNVRAIPKITKEATLTVSSGDADKLLDGIERPSSDGDHAWEGNCDDEIVISFKEVTKLSQMRLVFDNDINRDTWSEEPWFLRAFSIRCNYFLDDKPVSMFPTLIKGYEVYGKQDGEWKLLSSEKNNYQRLVKINIDGDFTDIKFIPKTTWGGSSARIYALDVV